ncbi:unnamed protein product [Adineta steineri]|uniref:Major facilitator superfamily (MFS) profile domain-containing protein n=2 Tax=Adineta steineri TaxID=433720 RepID=A0A819EGK7_9BILA|nr:unnamed protein product [Adineta steineri]CAF3850607.1 unnamed protein product [Adineta steineri]
MDEVITENIPVIDQENQQKFLEIAIRRLIRKLDRRLLPYLYLLELASYIIRTNIGHATLMGINDDLHLSQSQSEWAVSLYFLAYLIFEMPNILLMRYLGPARYLPLSMLAWGGITIGMAFVKNAQALLPLRFFLGIAQAGYFPSIIIYISLWYRKRDHTMRIGIIYSAAIISEALSSIMAYGFSKMNNVGSLQGWQWMFLFEGLPMIPLGIITGLFLSNIPDTVQWLNIAEKHLLTNILRNDTIITNNPDAHVSWKQILHVFTDRHIYLYALISMGNLGIIKYLSTSLPSIVQDMGTSSENVHLMTAPPYAFAFFACLLVNYSASRNNEHGFHLIFGLSFALLGFILTITLNSQSHTALYISSCITCCGVFSAFPVLLSWATKNVDGHTKKPVTLSFIIGIGQLGGIILPLTNDNKPTRGRNDYICLGALAASLFFTIILRISLMIENRRRSKLSPDEYNNETSIKESCDWHPDIRYAL